MARGDIYQASAGDTEDIFYVDTGMYETPEYGAVYLINSDRPALVETGIGMHSETVLDGMADVGIAPADLAVIAPTHVHLDHAGGAGVLAEACPNADVYVPERGARHLVDPERLWAGTKAAVGDQITHYAEPTPVPAVRVVELADGDEIDLGDRVLHVHDAPGHAPHQAVFHDPAADGVFTADAAGIIAPGLDHPHPTTPPPDFDLEQSLADIEMLQDLDPAALYYSHFGDVPAADHLDTFAMVLETWVRDIADKRATLDTDEAVVDHFVQQTELGAAWGDERAHSAVAMDVRGVLGYLDNRDE